MLWTILISNLSTANWLRFLNSYITAGVILSQSSNLLTLGLCYFGSNASPTNLKFTKAEYSISSNTLSWSWASLMNYPSIASVTAISNYMLALNQNQEIWILSILNQNIVILSFISQINGLATRQKILYLKFN